MKSKSKTSSVKSKTKAKSSRGSSNKITDQIFREGEGLYRNTLDNMLEGCQILGKDWRYLYLNSTAEVHNRRPNQELVGNVYMDMWPGIEETHVFSVIKQCMEARVAAQLENRFIYPDGTMGWFSLSIQPIPEGVLILSFDISKRVQAEMQVTRIKRLYATLSQINQTIVRVKEQADLYQSICDIAVQFGEFTLAWIGLLDEQTGEVRPVTAKGLDVAQWPFPTINIHQGDFKNGLIATAIRTSRVVTSEDLQANQTNKNLHTLLKELDYHSSAVVPFHLRGKTIGVLNLVSSQADLFKAEEEIRLLEEMGLDISFALDTMETEAKQKQAEAERASLARFPGENPSPVMRLDPDGIILYANEASKSLLEEWDSAIGDYAPDFWCDLATDAFASHTNQIIDVLHGERIFSFFVVPIVEGGYTNIYGRDVTQRVQAEEALRRSEERFRSLYENATIGLYRTTPNGEILLANPALVNMLGYSSFEELAQRNLEQEGYAPDYQRDGFRRQIEKDGIVIGLESVWTRNDGKNIFVRESAKVIRDVDGNVIYYEGTVEDITERKQAEKKLELQNRRLKVLREIDVAILAADSVENIVGAALDHVRELIECERANLALIEWEKNEAVNFDVRDTKESAISKGARVSLDLIQDILQVLARNQPILINDLTAIPDPLPQIKTFIKEGLRSRCILPLFSQGNLIGSLTLSSAIPSFFNEETVNLGREVANQITIAITQNHLLKSLRESEDRYRTFFQNSMDAILLTTPDGSIHAANPAACKMLGHTEAEIIALGRDGITDHDDPRLAILLEERAKKGEVFGELNMLRNDGTTFPVEMSSAIFRDRDGKEKTSMIIRDISERKQAEERLIDSEHRYRRLFESAQDAILILDAESGEIIDANPFIENLLEYPVNGLIGRQIWQLGFLKDIADNKTKLLELQEKKYVRYEDLPLQTQSGKKIHAEFVSNVYTVDGVEVIQCNIRDVTERKQAEDIIQNRNQMMLAIHKVALEIGAELHLPLLLSSIMEQAQSMLKADRGGGIYLHEPGENVLTLAYGSGINKGRDGIKLQTGEGVAGRVFQTSQPIIVDDYTHWNGHATVLVTDPPSAVMGLPLFWKDNAIGVLTLIANSQLQKFTHEDVKQAEIFAAQAAVAIQNARLYQQAQQEISERKLAEKKLERQNLRLKALREIDTAILAADSTENIVGEALSHIRELLGCQRAGMALIDQEANEAIIFDVKTASETSITKGNRIPLMLFQSLPPEISKPLLNNQPVIIHDLTELPDPPPLLQVLSNEGLRSVCILPLSSQDSQIGTFNLSSEIPGFFDEEKISLGREVANQVAIAITQNRLIKSLQELNIELEQRVVQRTSELTRTNAELEEANRIKSDFLASMSHELRTPLNSILGLSETMLEQRRDPLSERQQQSLLIIQSSGQHLLELINDVLDLSKIEAGMLDYYPQIIEMDTLCRSSLALIKEQAMRKSITLTYEEEKTVSKIYADPRRLKQILVNLLTNAVKFTPDQGQVTLHVRGDEEQDMVQLSVTDTGIGISSEDLKRLFKPFVQVDSALNRQYEGTGLGLALVQRLTDLHGGSVQVESEAGKGSRFTVNIPWGKLIIAQLEYIEAGGERLVNNQHQESTKALEAHTTVLLVEDNAANILTIGEYLENHGYKVATAHDGFEALEKAKEISPDIILMDIQMPEMDGLEATRRLRANPRFNPTPIIALTALAMPGDRERCFEAGVNEYMSKPVSLKGLVKTIDNLLRNKKV